MKNRLQGDKSGGKEASEEAREVYSGVVELGLLGLQGQQWLRETSELSPNYHGGTTDWAEDWLSG